MAYPYNEGSMSTENETPTESPKSRRGFASMDAERQREIASKGGKAAHTQKRAHEFTVDEARVAGKKGGDTISRDRAHMASIGRAGGQARGRNRALAATRAAAKEAEEAMPAERVSTAPATPAPAVADAE
jgi:general stress protein YciG